MSEHRTNRAVTGLVLLGTGLALGGCGQSKFASIEPSYRMSDRECLARVMYFESNRSSEDGMLAVGTVVMNRLESGRYPKTVCGVIGQKNQFAEGALTKPMDQGNVTRAMKVAEAVLEGKRHRGVGKAMFFHTNGYTYPYKNMHYVMLAGGNAFYIKRQPTPDLPNRPIPSVMVAAVKKDPTRSIVVADASAVFRHGRPTPSVPSQVETASQPEVQETRPKSVMLASAEEEMQPRALAFTPSRAPEGPNRRLFESHAEQIRTADAARATDAARSHATRTAHRDEPAKPAATMARASAPRQVASLSEAKGSDSKGSDSKGSDSKGSSAKAHDSKASGAKLSDAKNAHARIAAGKVAHPKVAEAKVSEHKALDAKATGAKAAGAKASVAKVADAKASHDAKKAAVSVPAGKAQTVAAAKEKPKGAKVAMLTPPARPHSIKDTGKASR